MAVLHGGAPAVSVHSKALRGALEFRGDHADLPRLPRVWLEAPTGFVHVRGGESTAMLAIVFYSGETMVRHRVTP